MLIAHERRVHHRHLTTIHLPLNWMQIAKKVLLVDKNGYVTYAEFVAEKSAEDLVLNRADA